MSYEKHNFSPSKEDCANFIWDMTNYAERISEKNFTEALIEAHPALQQIFWRIMKQVIFSYSELDGGYVDPRNQASIEFCKRIAEGNKPPMHVGLPTI